MRGCSENPQKKKSRRKRLLSVDAAVVAGLTELDSIFTIKEQKQH